MKTRSVFVALGNVQLLNGISTQLPHFSFNSLQRFLSCHKPTQSYRLLTVTQCFAFENDVKTALHLYECFLKLETERKKPAKNEKKFHLTSLTTVPVVR